MNRVIKFRAWIPKSKRMITHKQNFIPLRVTNFGVERLCATQSDNLWQDVDEPVVLMQFTGLLDKNGTEIFEGDIVNYTTYFAVSNPYVEEEFEREIVGVVSLTASKGMVLNKAKYRESHEGEYLSDLEFKKMGYAVSFSARSSRVIGNIHQHPHLLKSEE